MKLVKKNITLRIKALLTIITIISITASCQTSPEEEIVVNKDDGKMQEIIESNVETETMLETTKSWQTILEEGSIKINVDAVIEIPAVDKYPILSITPIELDQKWVDRSLEVLFQGSTPYNNIGMTKQVIEKKILNNKMIMEQINAGKIPYGFTEDTYDLLYQENQVLTQIHEKAPEENEIMTNPAKTSLVENENGLFLLNFIGKIKESDYSNLIIMNNRSVKLNYIQFYNYDNNSLVADVKSFEYYDELKINGVSLSVDEAQKIAEDVLVNMEIDNVELTDIRVANIFYIKPSIDIINPESNNQAYEFIYSKTYNGINVFSFSSAMMVQQKENDIAPEFYTAVLAPEKIIIRVDDSGVVFFGIKNPTISEKVITDNASLLDIDKIKDIFSNQIFYHYYYDNPNGKMTISINKMVLSYFVQPKIDNNSEYIAIPVWDFIGEMNIDGQVKKYTEEEMTFLTINAIDGSVISRDIGN